MMSIYTTETLVLNIHNFITINKDYNLEQWVSTFFKLPPPCNPQNIISYLLRTN